MAINPLQGVSATRSPAEICAAKKNVSAPRSAFEALLEDRARPDVDAQASQQAKAELLRMEMMKSTFSLFGSDEAPSRGGETLDALLSSLVPNLPAPYAPVPEAPMPRNSSVADEASRSLTQPNAELDGIEQTAERFLGIPYRFGGEGENGIDCSSFVQQVYKQYHVDLPRTAREQIAVGTDVATGELRKGDLVFFHTYASFPSHVGIYLGDGKMIHASSGKGEVTISDMNSDYYRSRYLGAKRIV